MKEADKKLLIDLDSGSVTFADFLNRFSVDLKSDKNFIRTEIEAAIQSADPTRIQTTIPLIWLSADIPGFVDLLNELLINPNHRSHQVIAKGLQDSAPSPTTIPFVRKALETNFDYLAYTCSNSYTIAKWFSWLLYSIGTEEAINLMKEYSNSADEGIANEMRYRLNKVHQRLAITGKHKDGLMENKFEKLMSSKSDVGLQKYLDDRTKFTPEAVEAAIAEMQNRGRTFSDEELASLRQALDAKREAEDQEEKELFGNQWSKNVVTDENAPVYYSESAIYMFSAFFNVFFGAVLLAINFRSTGTKKGIWAVIVFGIVYTGLQFYMLSLVPRNTLLVLLFNMGGGLLLNHFFWKKHIGRDTKYRAKPIWIPLIIGIIIFVPILLATIANAEWF